VVSCNNGCFDRLDLDDMPGPTARLWLSGWWTKKGLNSAKSFIGRLPFVATSDREMP
jgi:hypothetical protein